MSRAYEKKKGPRNAKSKEKEGYKGQNEGNGP